jgi:hypothetical protein
MESLLSNCTNEKLPPAGAVPPGVKDIPGVPVSWPQTGTNPETLPYTRYGPPG